MLATTPAQEQINCLYLLLHWRCLALLPPVGNIPRSINPLHMSVISLHRFIIAVIDLHVLCIQPASPTAVGDSCGLSFFYFAKIGTRKQLSQPGKVAPIFAAPVL